VGAVGELAAVLLTRTDAFSASTEALWDEFKTGTP
jgi:hypothetical protein